MEMNTISIVLGALAISCLLISGFIFTQEIGEVNRKLPEDQQISYWWMYSEKYMSIKKEYKRLYPQGRLHFAQFILQILGFVFLFLAVIAAGFFKH